MIFLFNGKGRTLSGFDKVIGHTQIIDYFKKAIAQDKLAHSYIITGEKGSGKKLLAGIFAKTLQCELQGVEPCDECRSCKQSDSGNQPDIIWVKHEKPGSIGVDDVRDQLVGDIMIKPYSSRYKIYIVDEAEKLTVQAQNALLKTIEEPPAYGIIIFLTTNADMFLPTIVSRCINLNLYPLASKLVKAYLMEEFKVPDYKADVCVAFSQGNMGKAIQLAKSAEFDFVKSQFIRLIKNIENIGYIELLQAVKDAQSEEFGLQEYLDFILIWYRDVLFYKAAGSVDGLVFREEVSSISARAAKISYDGIEAIVKAIEIAKARLNANVNEEIVTELMFSKIKES